MNSQSALASRWYSPAAVLALAIVLLVVASPAASSGIVSAGSSPGNDPAGYPAGESSDVGASLDGAPPFYMYVSFRQSGRIGGVSFTPSDILKYHPDSGWSMFFDGSDVGVTKNLRDFELMDFNSPNRDDDLSILMSFSDILRIANTGTFKPQDIARFNPTSLGPSTNGYFEWSVPGSQYGLTTLGERIDGLGEGPHHILAISTTGVANVTAYWGDTIRAQNEDALGFHPYWREWSLSFDGTAVSGLAVENLSAIWIDQLTGDLYVTIPGAFNLRGVTGNGKDVVRLSPNGLGGYVPSLFWDGSAHGLPTAIDGLEIVLGQTADLAWPIGCVPGETCVGMGYPDIDGDGQAFNCGQPGYTGHSGTDIGVTWAQMDAGMPVYAAADGVVLWTREGEYDRCPSSHPHCQPDHYYCFGPGDFCGAGTCCCTWCFTGNLVVIRHSGLAKVFATTYGHLRTGSILVTPGQIVSKGQKIAEVGSSGNSSGPHLHFDVWGTGFWEPTDPWAGSCGPNFEAALWQYDPPWSAGGSNASAAPFYGPDAVVPRYEPETPAVIGGACPALEGQTDRGR